jgi:hypothetical protein
MREGRSSFFQDGVQEEPLSESPTIRPERIVQSKERCLWPVQSSLIG